MKHALLILASFLSLSATAQKTSFPIKNELPAYKPVNFDLYKKFKSPDPSFVISNSKEASGFSLIKNKATAPDFNTLLNNLSDDKQFFKLQQKKTEWTNFSSGVLHSYSSSYTRQRWFENKNHVQQRWMAQKIKGKQ